MNFDFNKARPLMFGNKLSQLQVDSINGIINECTKQGITSKEQVAYILATAYHEAFDYDGKSTGTIQRLVPIKEKGGDAYLKEKKYFPYVGYGFCQITWDYNYKKFAPLITKLFNVDVMKNPELFLRVDIASYVIVHGMKMGTFTSKKLDDYINKTKVDYKSARRIINGTDKADLIAGYAEKFVTCLN